jgi:Na+/citrate or Na+/malate symporter
MIKTTLLKEIQDRASLPTPKFFKKLRAWTVCIGLTLTSFSLTMWVIYPQNTILIIMTIVGATATAIGTFMTYLPVEWNEVSKPKE